MFRCTECECEYKEKPDYCDCGNDIFVEIKTEQNIVETPPEPVREIYTPPKIKSSVDPLSLGIFVLCIIFSFVIIFFIGNPKDNLAEEIKTEQSINQDIPSIDKFWNNSTVGVKSDVKEVPQTPVPIQQIVKKLTPKPVETKTTTANVPAQNIQKRIQKTAKVPTQTQVPIQKTTKQTTPPKIPQNTLNAVNNTKVQTTKPTQQNPQTNQHVTQPKQVDNTLAKQELANYKISLRNTIGRKIDFTKVIGDGSCTVSFKISSSGTLTNRAFTKQSSNLTLNDAVFNAVKSTPKFNPPPELYNNETLNLNIKFTNGNFEITLN